MKNIINTTIQSEQYGEGTIISIDSNNTMTIDFPKSGIKLFKYPDAFCKSIQSDDLEIQKEAEDEWVKKLEKKQMEEAKSNSKKRTAELILTPEEAKQKQLELEEILRKIDVNKEFNEKTNRIFIVHQGKTFDEEYVGGYLWAPSDKIHHHECMTSIQTGDIIFNYANGTIQSVSEAVSNWFHSPIPSALYGHGWYMNGYRAQIRYNILSKPQSLNAILSFIIANRAPFHSSFNINGGACQGYLYELEASISKEIKNLILSTPQPANVVKVLNRI